MNVAEFDIAVTDHAAALLLRYFTGLAGAVFDRPFLALERDRELLRLHWALSEPVADLAQYVIEHRHEIQSVLGSALRVEDGILRGRLDAVATIKLRRRSGLATALVSHEPLRSYASGPNQLLGWVLKEAWLLASRFSSIPLHSEGYRKSVDRSLQRLEQCRRLHAIAQISGQASLDQRPSSGAVLEAGRSRRTLYRKAKDAYDSLMAIETGDPVAITNMLSKTLLAPQEAWRRFELAVGLAAADAIASTTGKPLSFNLLVGDGRSHLAQVGNYSIYWQSRTEYYRSPLPEPSEKLERHILDAYGFSASSDRPDLVVVDRERKAVIAIIEVKYLTGEDASDRVRSAVGQIVRYARGYKPIEEMGPLLGMSLAVVSQGFENFSSDEAAHNGIPSLIDFGGIKRGALRQWAERLSPVFFDA